MKLSITHLAAAFLLTTAPMGAQAQWTGPITFFGCDGARSCHTMQFFSTVFDSSPNYQFVTFQGLTEWKQKGAFADCSTGCAWGTDLPPLSPSDLSDLRHASHRCWGIVDIDVFGFPIVGYGNLCPAGTRDDWGGWGFRAPLNWRPTVASVSVVYAESVFSPFEPPSPATTANVALSLVPEPGTAALVTIGLAALIVGSRVRRRPRR